jgi:3-hydroxyisobutyrate dehydrogenase-like beta-hydroxyacid dehydrogenase
MGANMARRLHDVGYRITRIYDVEPNDNLAAQIGAEVADNLPEVTATADAVITVVPDDSAMHSIFDPSAAALLRDADGQLFINCATITPSVHVAVERAADAAGAHTLEACMASSITQAREGTLYLMCGGRMEAYKRAEPILNDLSSTKRFIGPAGTAAQVKALVNMVMNVNTAGLAEGLGLADALGIDLALVREVFAQTGAASRMLETDADDMQLRDHEVYFSAAHAAKDSSIALELAASAGLELPVAAATKRQYERLIDLGKGELDKSAVAELTFRGRAAN